MQYRTLKPGCFLAAALLAALSPIHAHAQAWPARAVRLIIPFSPGGAADVPARIIMQRLSDVLGQQIVIENRPGAGSTIGADVAAKALPDGYTLFLISNTHFVSAALYQRLPYDSLNDFTPVTQVSSAPNVLVIHPALPAKSVKELIALAKARPGELSYGSSGNGSTGHFAAELFNQRAGLKLLHVPYKGNAQALLDIIAGQVMMMFDQVSTSTPLIQAGKLRALGVSTRTRSPLLPEVPTIDEAGVPGYESFTFNGLVAPAGTLREALVRLHEEVSRAGRNAELRKLSLKRGVELTVSASPEEFTAYIRAEHEKMGKLMRAAGIKPE